MTHDYGKPANLYAQLGSIRMSAAERRDAISHLKRGEAIANLILGAAILPRHAAAGVTRAFVKLLYNLLTRKKDRPRLFATRVAVMTMTNDNGAPVMHGLHFTNGG
jgi:hypothetical protein